MDSGSGKYSSARNNSKSKRILTQTKSNMHSDIQPHSERCDRRHYSERNHSGERKKRNADFEYKKKSSDNWRPRSGENLQKSLRTNFTSVFMQHAPSEALLTDLKKSYIAKCIPQSTTVDEIIRKSRNFWSEFPSETARLDVLLQDNESPKKLQSYVESVYPIIHHSCLNTLCDFLAFKKQYGSNIERRLYANMDVLSFVTRLLTKRPLSFLGVNDRYLLPNLKECSGHFETIGTDREQPPLVLRDLISYDEMRLSAMLSLSSWSVFVNDGARKNFGKKGERGSYERDGVIVGQVGTRLKKVSVMEYLDCVISREQNVPANGFGQSSQRHVNSVFSKLWNVSALPTYEEGTSLFLSKRDENVNKQNFDIIRVGKDLYLNVTIFKKRILITAEILLCEANTRARESGKKAYVHVVGLGLGVWRISDLQDELFVEAWGDAIKNVSNTSHIGHIDFSYIGSSSVHGVRDGERFSNTNIVIHFSRRNLHSKVPSDCILVCNYAWNGNTLPGNEFWMGKACSTGDSAAACSSCVAEIHNHMFNPLVCGETLRISTKDGFLVTWQKYLQYCDGENVLSLLEKSKVPSFEESEVLYLKPKVLKQPKIDSSKAFDNIAFAQPEVMCSTSSSSCWSEKLRDLGNESPSLIANIGGNVGTILEKHFSKLGISDLKRSEKYDNSVHSVEASYAVQVPKKKKKQKQVAESEPESVSEEIADEATQNIPPKIPHEKIPGLYIDNPVYIQWLKQKKQREKLKGDKAKDTESKLDEYPPKIPHEKIPGLHIDNPAYIQWLKQKKQREKLKGDKVKDTR